MEKYNRRVKIGIYDSGLGGLSVLNELLKYKFDADYIYLADNKNAQYGDKTEEELKKIVDENLKKLLNKKLDLIIIACNTASYIYFKYLKENNYYSQYKNKIYYITKSSINYIIQKNIFNFSVLETEILYKNNAFSNLFFNYVKDDKYSIKEISGKNLAGIIEKGENPKKALYDSISKIDNKSTHLILSCTHYGLIEEEFKNALKEKNVEVINPAKYLAEEFKNILRVKNRKNNIKLINTLKDKTYINDFNKYLYIKKESNIKKIFSKILLTIIGVLTIILSTFFVYSNLNKKSGLDSIFHLLKNKEMTAEEAVENSKKYINLLYNDKVKEYNIVKKDEKYYFSSERADIVLDKVHGDKYFDLITTKEYSGGKEGKIEKGEEAKKISKEDIKPSIYIKIPKKEKLNNKKESIIEESNSNIYIEKDDLSFSDNKKNIEFKENIIDLYNMQNKLISLMEKKAKEENKKSVNKEISDLSEEINKKKEKLVFGKTKKYKIETALNKDINSVKPFVNKESLDNENLEEIIYTNRKIYEDALILGITEDKNIIVMKNNKIYLFENINMDEYFKNVDEKIKKIKESAKKIKEKIFTYKEFEKYSEDDELDFKNEKEIGISFSKVDRGIKNRACKIHMIFNSQNEKLLEIKVNVNNIPYSEVKINKFDASKIALDFLKKRNLIKEEVYINEKGEKEYDEKIEKSVVEIDYTNNYFEDLEVEKGQVEKMWKVKFKDNPYIIYIDTYYGKILGGEKQKN